MSTYENPTPPPGQWQQPAGGTSNETTWASAAHWGALVVWFFTSGVFAFVAPLVVMTTQGKNSALVRRHAVSSLNFQLSLLIYALGTLAVLLVGIVLSFVLIGIPIVILAGIALVGLAVAGVVLPILAAVKAANGEEYHYPFTITLVS